MEYPRIFALVCLSTESVEYTSEQYSKVSAMYRSLPLPFVILSPWLGMTLT